MISYQFYKISSNTISGISRAYVDVLNLHIQGPRGPSLICGRGTKYGLPGLCGAACTTMEGRATGPPAKFHQDHLWQVHKKMRCFMRCFTRCLPLKMGRIYEKKWRHTDDRKSFDALEHETITRTFWINSQNAPMFFHGFQIWEAMLVAQNGLCSDTCPEGNGCYPGRCNCTRRKHRPGRPGWERSTKIWDSAITTWPHMPHGNGSIAGP